MLFTDVEQINQNTLFFLIGEIFLDQERKTDLESKDFVTLFRSAIF